MKKSPLSSLIVITLSVSLTLSTFTAESAPTRFSGENVPKSRTGITASSVVIPARLGIVDERFQGKSGKVIFHIKDAHCNYYAQKSIYALIDWVSARYGADVVNLEGASGKYDLSALENIEDLSVKTTIADTYLKEGKLNGAELYRVFNPSKVTLAGIEDPGLYEADLAAYRLVLDDMDNIRVFMDVLRKVLAKMREKFFSPELKAFDDNRELFHSNKLAMARYMAYLSKAAADFGVKTGDLGDLALLSEALAKEKTIDFKKAENERGKLVDVLLGRMSRYERTDLTWRIEAFGKGSLGEEELYSYLIEKAREAGTDISVFPDLKAYSEYLAIYGNINDSRLFAEIRSAEERIAGALLVTDEQKKVYRYLSEARLLDGMFGLKADRHGYEEARSSADIQQMLAFLSASGASGEDMARLSDRSVSIENALTNMMVFYSLAAKRDEAFIANVEANMELSSTGSGIVVTGGFHSENFLSKLREKGISYVSIKPSFLSNGEGDGPYFELLSGRYRGLPADIYSLLSSTMQVKSLWSELGMDTDFAASFLLRLNTAIEEAKLKGAKDILLVLGKRKVYLGEKSDYKPTLAFPTGWGTKPGRVMIDIEKLMGMKSGEILEKLSPLEGKDEALKPAVVMTGSSNIEDTLKLIMFNGSWGVTGSPVVEKKAYLLTYEGKIVERKVRGMKNVDTFVYIFDVRTGVLMCQFSSGRSMSGFMLNPSVVSGKNEKSYLCEKLRQIFRPGISSEEKKRIISGLIAEQENYETKGECGWEWQIDRDEEGTPYVDEGLGFGLRSFILHDRTKLPAGIEAQNMDTDADIYGGRENVQEMQFEITPMEGDKVKILLINSWAAAAKVRNLQEAAHKDPLSGLWNRRYFIEAVKPEVEAMVPMTILFIDADHFKLFNDEYSHQFGDTVLKSIAHVILTNIRGADVAVRWGGEEFVVFLPGTSISSGKVVAEKILRNVKKERPEGIRDDDKVSVTIGVVEYGGKRRGQDIDTFVDKADKAMYAAKGKNNRGVVFVVEDSEAAPAAEEAAPAATGFKAVAADKVLKDLTAIFDTHLPSMIRSLKEFLEKEKISGMSQGEGIEHLYLDLTRGSFTERLDKLRGYRLVLYNTQISQIVSDETRDATVADACRELSNLYERLSGIRERFFNVSGDTYASPRVKDAMVSLESIMDLSYKYLPIDKREGMMASPWITADGEPLMWLTKDGVMIWHPLMKAQTQEMQRWNMRHEKWERRLMEHKEYRASSRAARDIAATFFAFNEFDRITDDKLDDLLYAILPEFWLVHKEKRHENFVKGAVKYLRETSLEYFKDTTPADLEKEAMTLIENVRFQEAREAYERRRSADEYYDALLTIAYIGGNRQDLLNPGYLRLMEETLRSEGAPGRVYIEICRSVENLAEKGEAPLSPSVMGALNELFGKKGLDPKVYPAAAGAVRAMSAASPEIAGKYYGKLAKVLKLEALSGALDIDGMISRDLKSGDRKAVGLLCTASVYKYLSGLKNLDFTDSVAAGLSSRPAEFPGLIDGRGAISEKEFWSSAGAREKIKDILKSRYIEGLVARAKMNEELGIPSVEGMLSVTEGSAIESGSGERPNTALWQVLGLAGAAKGKSLKVVNYQLPECSDNFSQSIYINTMREMGLVPGEGMHVFSEAVKGRMSDGAKYIQMANIILYPVRYNWGTFSCDSDEAGIPPIAYGVGRKADTTVFPGGVVYSAPVTTTGDTVMKYDTGMEYFDYMQRSKQLLSWAFQAYMMPEGDRTPVQKRLAEEWGAFTSSLDDMLEKRGLKESLASPVWISTSSMDGREPNENGWTYGSVARRQTIQEGLEKLEKARRAGEMIGEVSVIMSRTLKRVESIAADRRRELTALGNKKVFWDKKSLQIFGTRDEAAADTVADPLKDVLERAEKAFEAENAGGFSGEHFSARAFSDIAASFLEWTAPEGPFRDESAFSSAEDRYAVEETLARISMRAWRSPGEMRIIIYPVYNEAMYTKEVALVSELRQRLSKSDYGAKVCLIPYFSGSEASRKSAFDKLAFLAKNDPKARAFVYAESAFVDAVAWDARSLYGDRVMFVKEEGRLAFAEGFSYLSPGFRAAFAVAVLDYFDPRNGFGDYERQALKDRIASMIGIITGDAGLMAAFAEDPEGLVKGLIVLRPVVKISLEEAEENMEMTRQFLHSL